MALRVEDIPIKTVYYSDGKHSHWFDLPSKNKYGLDISIGHANYEPMVLRFLEAKRNLKGKI